MAKKISFGKISLSSSLSNEASSSSNRSSGFGVINDIKSTECNTISQSVSSAGSNAKSSSKQAKKFDVEKMMDDFNKKVEQTKIDGLNEAIKNENEVMNSPDISQVMGFSGFGKVGKQKPSSKNGDSKINENAAKSSGEKTDVKSLNDMKSNPENKALNEKEDNSDDDMSSDDDEVGTEGKELLPISHEIKLYHSSKAVSGLALDPAGARLVTGSQDFDVKFWDFNAMDSRFQSFRTIQPMENYHIRSIEYSITGDLLLLASGGPQAQVLDRDGSQVYECRKGDQYIVDMTRTNGHVSALYNAVWHTRDRNIFMTSSSDCTVRFWDINVTKNQKTVIKLKGSDGKKVSPTHAVFNKDSSMIAVATIDGSLSLYPTKGPFVRAKLSNKTAHVKGTETSCLKFSIDGNRILSRGGDDTVKLWDLRNISKPVHSASSLDNVFIGTDCWFSPDEKVVMTGTSVKRGSGELVFFDANSFDELYRFSVGESSVSKILWHPKLNQIVVGCSNGIAKVYYSPNLSSRGALLCAAKPRRRQVKNDEIPTGLQQQVINPYSLPMYREQRFLYAKRRKDKGRKDPLKSAAPDKPAFGLDAHKTKGCSLSAFVSKQIAMDTHGPPAEEEDPREVLLKYADVCEKDPYWIAPAYGPETKNVYQEVTEETLDEEPAAKKPMYFYNK
ncbi:hypothetical protein ACHWQZ_G014988 [Mnemiopsis leidyi]